MNLPSEYCVVAYVENIAWYRKNAGLLFLEGPEPGFVVEPTNWSGKGSSSEQLEAQLKEIDIHWYSTASEKPIYVSIPCEAKGIWQVQAEVKKATGLPTARLTVPYTDLEDYVSSWTNNRSMYPNSWNKNAAEDEEWLSYVEYSNALRNFDLENVNRSRLLWSTLHARDNLEWNATMQYAEKNNALLFPAELRTINALARNHFRDSFYARAKLQFMPQPHSE